MEVAEAGGGVVFAGAAKVSFVRVGRGAWRIGGNEGALWIGVGYLRTLLSHGFLERKLGLRGRHSEL